MPFVPFATASVTMISPPDGASRTRMVLPFVPIIPDMRATLEFHSRYESSQPGVLRHRIDSRSRLGKLRKLYRSWTPRIMSNAMRLRPASSAKDEPDRDSDRVVLYLPPPEESLEATLRIANPGTVVLGPHLATDNLHQLGSYDLIEQLGSGGMGIVYAARDRESGQVFALKILRPSLVMEAEAKARFQSEARAMAAIGHQRIVPVVRIGEDNGIPYIVMPLLLGETLEDRLAGLEA